MNLTTNNAGAGEAANGLLIAMAAIWTIGTSVRGKCTAVQGR